MTKLWLDDQSPEERPAIACPSGWLQVFTAQDCIAALEKGGVEILSLDCDLGAGGSGYSVANWLEVQAYADNWSVIPVQLECHSANPVERRKVLAAFSSVERLRSLSGAGDSQGEE